MKTSDEISEDNQQKQQTVSSDAEPITAEAIQSIIDYIEEGEPDLKVITGELGELILRSTGEYFNKL